MNTKPVIVVAGLGRCGSSLTMQMLAAGGIPCVGQAPAYEDGRALGAEDGKIPSAVFDTLAGHAVKILDPHRVGVPRTTPSLVIWLERRQIEQARSIAKMLHLVERMPKLKTSQITRLQLGLAMDTSEARKELVGLSLLVMQFEETLARPDWAASRIAHFIAPYYDLDVSAAAAAVRKREPLCAPDLSMELELLSEAVRNEAEPA